MKRILGLLAVLAMAGPMMGCAGTKMSGMSDKGMKASMTASEDSSYVCHMGEACGSAKLMKGEKIPQHCGQAMVKADGYSCHCGNKKLVKEGDAAPMCCGGKMEKQKI